ncbi:hypothetical protein QTI66_15265 [Variovorax sp. J22R133]|uniref:hypothetical protein n=1 Tax=Variovorax brevis TaxID=3053503 RepID=UPI002577367D|nr:hypothetical protein [Variovorax sp. J22R133]MDM0113518.1 hypothetical protein [Variovorax sp. J22R133]
MNNTLAQDRCGQRVAVMLDRPTAEALKLHQRSIEQRTGARLSLSSTAAALLRQAVQQQAAQ